VINSKQLITRYKNKKGIVNNVQLEINMFNEENIYNICLYCYRRAPAPRAMSPAPAPRQMAPAPTHAQPPMQAQPKQPSMMANIATTAAGVAVGSAVVSSSA